jgi:phenylacetate-CoA ligase
MRQEIQDRLKILATDNYGISEVMGPGIAGECQEQNGLHINEDHFLAEIVNPETGQPVEPGQTGELVLTTLTKEAFPVIRFRTGDLTRLITDPCPCGRTFYRLSKILGRTDDMIIIRGVNVFPGQIESILLEIEGTRPHYQIVLDREEHLDRATLLVEANEALLSDRMRETQELVGRIRKRLASELGVTFEVKLVEPKSLKSCEDKQRRVIDKRRF